MAFPADRHRFEQAFGLEARGQDAAVAELGVELQAAQTLSYEWEADQEAEFNIHSHEGDEVTYHVKHRGRGAKGSFEAPHGGSFYLMWQNPGSEPVAVRVKARR
ncbi:MAG: hypothetical protein ACE5LS_03615 [Thermoplasmata archaeon]